MEYTHYSIDFLDDNIKNNINVSLRGGLGRESYCGINNNFISMEKIKYTVAIFDCDPVNDTFTMINWKQLMRPFNIFSKKSGKRRLNLEFPMEDNYVGNRVVLLPVFFCFETLYLLDDFLFRLYSKDRYINTYSKNKLYMQPSMREILLNYKICKEFEKDLSIQGAYTDASKIIVETLLKPYYNNPTVKEFMSQREIKFEELLYKKENILFELLEECKIYDLKNIKEGLLMNSIFNRELYEILDCKDILTLENILSTLTFDKYQSVIKRKLQLYKDIIDTDFQDKNVLDEF